jgi:outer membrane biosynthesis protein TonB
VGTIAAPLSGLVRGLNALIAGVAIQLQAIVDQGLVSGEAPAGAAVEAQPPEPEATAETPEPEATTAEPPEPETPAEPSEPEAAATQQAEQSEPEAAADAEPSDA